MEVRIRLQRSDSKAKSRYNYRVVAIPRNITRQGRILDLLGFYDPSQKPAVSDLNIEKIDAWVAKGAQMSDTVRSLVKKAKKAK
ncbi:MAG TPA: 30S ribosomal protein S16 [Candidatus Omnitrophota bacterium]|jgi:small subunit ribosomal protein S16|nr:30S ribosomal protein S16 [Candidatus Omnitrophota bacterium]HSA31052.1 30S ribosomal protein S16 [Candidatus Omnitrophota bacterium]